MRKTQAVCCSHPQNILFLLNWINLSLCYSGISASYIYAGPAERMGAGSGDLYPISTLSSTLPLFQSREQITTTAYKLVPHLISKRSAGPEYEKQILISSCTHSCNSNPSPSAFYGEKSSSAVWKGRLNQSLAHRSVANYLSCSISSNSNDENDHTVYHVSSKYSINNSKTNTFILWINTTLFVY